MTDSTELKAFIKEELTGGLGELEQVVAELDSFSDALEKQERDFALIEDILASHSVSTQKISPNKLATVQECLLAIEGIRCEVQSDYDLAVSLVEGLDGELGALELAYCTKEFSQHKTLVKNARKVQKRVAQEIRKDRYPRLVRRQERLIQRAEAQLQNAHRIFDQEVSDE